MKLIDADELLRTVREYNPAICNGASPPFVAGVYYCLREIMPMLIRAMKKYGGQ